MKKNSVCLSAIGHLCNIVKTDEGVVVIISIRCSHDELRFKCVIKNTLLPLFISLKKEISVDDEVILQFEASYTDIVTYDCIAKDDPERIINFTVRLNKVGFILVNGKERLVI